MERFDLRLLALLQQDSQRSIADLAAAAGMSSSSCQRRIKALEAAGYITGYAARVDPDRLGLDVHAFVEITLAGQSREALERFEAAVLRFDEILECHLMAGTADYLLRVSAADLKTLDRIHRECLSQLPGVASMRTNFSIRPIKRWRGYAIAAAQA